MDLSPDDAAVRIKFFRDNFQDRAMAVWSTEQGTFSGLLSAPSRHFGGDAGRAGLHRSEAEYRKWFAASFPDVPDAWVELISRQLTVRRALYRPPRGFCHCLGGPDDAGSGWMNALPEGCVATQPDLQEAHSEE